MRQALKLKIIFRIIIAYILNHTIQAFLVIRKEPLLHIIAKQIAEQAAEILMTRIRQERTAVGKHSDKTAQQAEYRQCIHLSCHTVKLIIKPPAATKLNLARARTILEVS